MSDEKKPATELPEGWEPSPQGCWIQNTDTSTCYADGALRVQYEACIATVPLGIIRALLASQGLRIIDEKDARVLEAIASASEKQLLWWAEHEFPGHWLRESCLAELARRGK